MTFVEVFLLTQYCSVALSAEYVGQNLKPFTCKYLLFCLFQVLRPKREFSFIWSRHHYRWRAWNILFYLYARHLGFFSVQRLLWQVASVYNGHLLTPVAVCLAVELSLPVSKISKGLSLLWFEHQPSVCEASAFTDCAAAFWISETISSETQNPRQTTNMINL